MSELESNPGPGNEGEPTSPSRLFPGGTPESPSRGVMPPAGPGRYNPNAGLIELLSVAKLLVDAMEASSRREVPGAVLPSEESLRRIPIIPNDAPEEVRIYLKKRKDPEPKPTTDIEKSMLD